MTKRKVSKNQILSPTTLPLMKYSSFSPWGSPFLLSCHWALREFSPGNFLQLIGLFLAPCVFLGTDVLLPALPLFPCAPLNRRQPGYWHTGATRRADLGKEGLCDLAVESHTWCSCTYYLSDGNVTPVLLWQSLPSHQVRQHFMPVIKGPVTFKLWSLERFWNW